ncbi:MAG TPA: EamA family transporter, partial [Gaiellaceae bacterium]|nr:EamA family transporter [Gaiellaceae bacterium]
GNALFAASSTHGLVSLTSVLASLYPVVTVLLAASMLHERVAPMQRAGIALTLTGVVLISF